MSSNGILRKDLKNTTLLNNSTYDVLKDVVTIYIPALATFYFAISAIWGLPYAEQVTGTAVALATLLGAILKISGVQYNHSTLKYDGALVVDTSDPDRDVYRLEVDTPLEDVANKNEITLKVDNSPLG